MFRQWWAYARFQFLGLLHVDLLTQRSSRLTPSTKDADSKHSEQKRFYIFPGWVFSSHQQCTQSITVTTGRLATSQRQRAHCRPALTDSQNLPFSTPGWVPDHLLKGESVQGEAWGHPRFPGEGEAGWSDTASRVWNNYWMWHRN